VTDFGIIASVTRWIMSPTFSIGSSVHEVIRSSKITHGLYTSSQITIMSGISILFFSTIEKPDNETNASLVNYDHQPAKNGDNQESQYVLLWPATSVGRN
jgi:hypothetical protein